MCMIFFSIFITPKTQATKYLKSPLALCYPKAHYKQTELHKYPHYYTVYPTSYREVYLQRKFAGGSKDAYHHRIFG